MAVRVDKEKPGLIDAVGVAFDIVVVASSAGGLSALTVLFGGMPATFAAPIVVVQHLDRRYPSRMTEILAVRTLLKVVQVKHAMNLAAGTIHMAPPDRHVVVTPDHRLCLTRTKLVNYVRPAADILFQSVAQSFGRRAIAIVLTGTGHDGTIGVTAIKKSGGVVIVQDETSSDFFGMPGSAIASGKADYVLPLQDIASALQALLSGETP